jgi:hypothetical protein
MRDRLQKRARLNALNAARELANRRAEVEDFEKVLAAIRSPIARSIPPATHPPARSMSPDEETQ